MTIRKQKSVKEDVKIKVNLSIIVSRECAWKRKKKKAFRFPFLVENSSCYRACRNADLSRKTILIN